MAEQTNIIKALVKVQEEITNPANTQTNPFFKSKYAPLNKILDLVRPLLSKNGLFLTQNTGTECYGEEEESLYIQTKIYHTSGECLKSDVLYLKPDKDSVQGMGSAITYGRRYQLSAMLGIAGEDDNDGNTSEKPKQVTKPKVAKTRPKRTPPKKPSEEDVINDIVNKEVKKGKAKPPADY